MNVVGDGVIARRGWNPKKVATRAAVTFTGAALLLVGGLMYYNSQRNEKKGEIMIRAIGAPVTKEELIAVRDKKMEDIKAELYKNDKKLEDNLKKVMNDLKDMRKEAEGLSDYLKHDIEQKKIRKNVQ